MSISLEEFVQRLKALRDRGYVETRRAGNTGVGHTLEQELGLTENNIQGPDLIDTEIKSQRRTASNRVTIFTFNRGVWKIRQKDLIQEYGYIDERGREALYCTVSTIPNPQGFYFDVSEESLQLYHEGGTCVAEWKIDLLMGIFNSKIPSLVLVIADSRMNDRGREEFWYNEAYYLRGKREEAFLEDVQRGTIVVDIRMHIKETGSVRNHGTGFRVDERYIANYFDERISLLE